MSELLKDYIKEIDKDKEIDGKDLSHLEGVKKIFENDKAEILDETKIKTTKLLKESLEKGYSVNNEADYKALQTILNIMGITDIQLPEYNELNQEYGSFSIMLKNNGPTNYLAVYKLGIKTGIISKGLSKEMGKYEADTFNSPTNDGKIDLASVIPIATKEEKKLKIFKDDELKALFIIIMADSKINGNELENMKSLQEKLKDKDISNDTKQHVIETFENYLKEGVFYVYNNNDIETLIILLKIIGRDEKDIDLVNKEGTDNVYYIDTEDNIFKAEKIEEKDKPKTEEKDKTKTEEKDKTKTEEEDKTKTRDKPKTEEKKEPEKEEDKTKTEDKPKTEEEDKTKTRDKPKTEEKDKSNLSLTNKINIKHLWVKEQIGNEISLENPTKEEIKKVLNDYKNTIFSEKNNNPANSARAIYAIQLALNLLGYTEMGDIDGVFGSKTKGSKTKESVIAFQKSINLESGQTKKLKVDGIPGKETITEILKKLG